jgi:hypothetical protein
MGASHDLVSLLLLLSQVLLLFAADAAADAVLNVPLWKHVMTW